MQQMTQQSVKCYSQEKLMHKCSDTELGTAQLFTEWFSFYRYNVFHPMNFIT